MGPLGKLLADLIAIPSVNPALLPAGDPHLGEERVTAFLEARAQAVAHTGLALNGHALVLEVRHVAVDGALRDFQPLGQEGGRGQPPPANELNDLEEAVGAAHGG